MIFYKYFLQALLIFFFFSTSAIAETTYGDIQLLIKQAQYKEALKLTEDQLSRNKADIKLQFMKGLILTRLERYSEAENVFIQLTKENPELPEPYNNLAVVYAAQGKYTQAEEALKDAINTHPSYATAHENLGDIYAKMASRAYNQALELDTSNQTAREKLSLINELMSAPAEPKPVPEQKPDKIEVAAVTPVPKPEAQPEAKSEPEPEPEKVVPTEPEIIMIPAKKEPELPQSGEILAKANKVDDSAEHAKNRLAVELTVNNWASAWSAQDVDAYLANYGIEFVPPKGLSRKQWEKDRRIKLKRPDFIKITLSEMKINLHGKEYAEVTFEQRYQSDTYGDKVKKELLMRKVNDKWLITQEIIR